MSETTTIPQPIAARADTDSDASEERGVIRGVTWDFYDRLSDALGEHSPFRVAYDGRDIEIMTLGPKHEDVRDLLSLFVNEVYFGLNINCKGLGSTTWKRAARRRGVEADLCYYFDAAKILARDAAAAARATRTTSPTIPTRTWWSRLISRRQRLTAPGFTVRCRFPRSGASAITPCRSSSSMPVGTT